MTNDFNLPPRVVVAYTQGDCWALALAMHAATGWTLVTASEGWEPEAWVHVGVLTPEGTVLDVEGNWDRYDWADEWGIQGTLLEPICYEWTLEGFGYSNHNNELQYDENPEEWAKKVLASYAALV